MAIDRRPEIFVIAGFESFIFFLRDNLPVKFLHDFMSNT